MKAAARARSLVQQILAYSRRQPQELASRPLAPLIRETAALLRATLPAGVALELELDATPLHTMCDPTQMQQVLMNLSTNAWHALRGGVGRIALGLEAFDADPADVRQVDTRTQPCVHVWVSDDGCGMDEPTRSRMFEPFYSTKPTGTGTGTGLGLGLGLGLSVVQGIVTKHAGRIVVDSAVGRGTTVHLHFPRVDADAGVEMTAPGPLLDTPPGRGEHVLYIDDDEVMLVMVEQLLRRSGYRVTCEADAWTAVAAVHESRRDYDVVVTDFNMPEFSGLDVLRDLAMLDAGLPVIVSSGFVSDSLHEQVRCAGARAVLQKENTLEELAALIRRVLDEPATASVAA